MMKHGRNLLSMCLELDLSLQSQFSYETTYQFEQWPEINFGRDCLLLSLFASRFRKKMIIIEAGIRLAPPRPDFHESDNQNDWQMSPGGDLPLRSSSPALSFVAIKGQEEQNPKNPLIFLDLLDLVLNQ